MANLKEDTLEILKSHGKTIKDIKWIGHEEGNVKIDVGYFFEIADREYDSGYGSAEVNQRLVVVGKDWWLSRWEYDGSEGWEYNYKPTLKKNSKFGKGVFVKDYEDDWSIMSNLEYLEWQETRHV